VTGERSVSPSDGGKSRSALEHRRGCACDELAPAVVVVDVEDGQFEGLAERIRSAGVKVVPIELLGRPLALLDKARPAVR
jgi:hypothetical protein